MTVVRSRDMGAFSWGQWAGKFGTTICETSHKIRVTLLENPSETDHALRDVITRMLRMNDDELEIMCQHAIRLDEGRKEYGPLHVDSDERDMGAEAIEELIDTVNYLTFKLMKMQRGGQ